MCKTLKLGYPEEPTRGSTTVKSHKLDTCVFITLHRIVKPSRAIKIWPPSCFSSRVWIARSSDFCWRGMHRRTRTATAKIPGPAAPRCDVTASQPTLLKPGCASPVSLFSYRRFVVFPTLSHRLQVLERRSALPRSPRVLRAASRDCIRPSGSSTSESR
jgi:hypothetical protein